MGKNPFFTCMERLKREGSEGRKSQFLRGILVGGWLRGGDIGVNLGGWELD